MAQSCEQLKSAMDGISIWAIDQFADRDCIEATSKVSQLDLADVSLDIFTDAGHAVSEELLFLPGGGTENYSKLVEQISATHVWCGITGEQIRSLRDPAILFNVARQAGLLAPLTYSHKTHPDQQSFAKHQRELGKNVQWLWKSSEKGGGLGVSAVRTEAEIAYFFSQTGGDYLQQLIPGAPYGATIIISSNGRADFIGACRLLTASDEVQRVEISEWLPETSTPETSIQRVITSHYQRDDFPYLFAGAVGPCQLPLAVREHLLTFAEACYVEFGIKGWFQVDFILDDANQAWVLEVNPRWSATMEIYERVLGISLTAAHLRAWGIDVPIFSPSSKACSQVCWKDVVYANSDFLWTEIHQRRASKLNREQISKIGWPLIADIPNGQQAFAPGMPIFSVIATGRTEAELQKQREDARNVLRK